MLQPRKTSIQSYPSVVDLSKLDKNGRFADAQVLARVKEMASNGKIRPYLYSSETLKEKGIDTNFSICVFQSPKGETTAYAVYDKPIGAGAFGTVNLIQDESGELSVLKTVNIRNQRNFDGFQHEVKMIDRLHGVNETLGIKTNESGNQAIFRQAYAKGSDLMSLPSLNLSGEQYLEVLQNIASELDDLHQKGVLHLDVKPQNMHIDPNTLKVTLVDFGESKEHINGEVVTTLTGTPNYMAPEHLKVFMAHMEYKKQKKSDPNYKGDDPAQEMHIYSTKSDTASLGKYIKLCLKFYPAVKGNKALDALAERMISENPADRPELSEVVQMIDAMRQSHRASVAVMDIDEYKSLSTDEKAAYCQRLAKFDEVKIISRQENVNESYIAEVHREVQRSILDAGHYTKIHTDILYGKNLDISRDLPGAIEVPAAKFTVTENVTPGSDRPQPTTASVQRLPGKIDIRDTIHGRLMTKEMFSRIRESLENGSLKIPKTEGQSTNAGKLSSHQLAQAGIHTPHSVLVKKQPNGKFEIHVVYEKEALGKGAFGTVNITMDESGKYRVAKSTADQRNPRYRNRVPLSESTEYKNLLRLNRDVTEQYYTDNKSNIFGAIVMDLVDGVPLDKADLDASQYLKVMRDISNELDTLRSHGIIYSDFKPENILVRTTPSGGAEIIDFGTIIKSDNENCTSSNGLQGSLAYLPPEFLEIKSRNGLCVIVDYSQQTDIYSLGITYAEMLDLHCDREVYGHEVYGVVSTDDEKFHSNTKISNIGTRTEIVEFLQKMTADDPNARPSPDEVQQFFQAQFSNRMDKTMSVGVINLNEVNVMLENSSDEAQELWLNSLKDYDEIAIIVPETSLDTVSIQKLMRVLDDADIPVNNGSIVYGSHDTSALLSQVKACYNTSDYELQFTEVECKPPTVVQDISDGNDTVVKFNDYKQKLTDNIEANAGKSDESDMTDEEDNRPSLH